jgi:hypothetical protein
MTDSGYYEPEYPAKEPVNVKAVRKLLADLRAGRSHKRPCICAACLFARHKASGGRFDAESFWLDWLEFEVRLSSVDTVERRYWQDHPLPERVARHVDDWREIYRVRGVVEAMGRFIALEFPNMDHGEARIRMKLWRLRKSGVLHELEQEAIGEIQKATVKPGAPTSLPTLRLAQRVADYVYSRPDRTASQRDLQRRFQKPVEVLSGFVFRRWLFVNYRIESRHEGRKNRVVYRGTSKSYQRARKKLLAAE